MKIHDPDHPAFVEHNLRVFRITRLDSKDNTIKWIYDRNEMMFFTDRTWYDRGAFDSLNQLREHMDTMYGAGQDDPQMEFCGRAMKIETKLGDYWVGLDHLEDIWNLEKF